MFLRRHVRFNRSCKLQTKPRTRRSSKTKTHGSNVPKFLKTFFPSNKITVAKDGFLVVESARFLDYICFYEKNKKNIKHKFLEGPGIRLMFRDKSRCELWSDGFIMYDANGKEDWAEINV